MTRLIKEPLVHFLILGALVFAWYNLTADQSNQPGEIYVSKGQQENLINTFQRTWQRPPSPQEFKGLLDDYVRQEIAYREGLELGMDQGDIIIRRRLRQKMELLAEDVASLAAPTEQQLQEYLDANAGDFQLEPVISVRHIYFSRDRRGDSAEADAVELLQRIRTDGPEGNFEEFGDPLPLPYGFDAMRESEIARLLGRVFTDGLTGLETGQWEGPVESGFGLHLVFISERVDGRVPELVEVREAVEREWFNQRRRDTIDGLYERLAEKYQIEIESLQEEPEQAES